MPRVIENDSDFNGLYAGKGYGSGVDQKTKSK
jgi:hypothetical protein